MAMLKTAGRFIARPVEWTVEESGSNKLPCFICRFDTIYHYNEQSAEWDDVQANDESITGYFYLLKTDGAENKRTLDDLQKVLGWDRRSFTSLVNGAWSDVEVQITTAFETYNGKESLKLKWLNPRDYIPTGGALKPVDPEFVKSLDARYGSILRASAGAAKPAPTTAAPADAAKKGAWDTFLKAWEVFPNPNGEDRNEKWKALVTGKFGARAQSGAVSAAEWKTFGDSIKANGLVAPADDAPGSDGPPPGIHKDNKAARQASKAPAMAMAGGGDEYDPTTDPSSPDYIPFKWSGRTTEPL